MVLPIETILRRLKAVTLLTMFASILVVPTIALMSRQRTATSRLHEAFKVLHRPLFSTQIPIKDTAKNGNAFVVDDLLTGLSGAQDIMVRVISLQQLVQGYIDRMEISDVGAKTFAEAASCTLLMGSSMKGEETLQVNLVGTAGLGSVTVIADSQLQLRGLVSNPTFQLPTGNVEWSMEDMFGSTGQVQVVRNHPSYKSPVTGIVALREGSIALNFALYLAESEQRTAAMITDVSVVNGKCEHALAVQIERLPGALDENVETAISNLSRVQTLRLASYLNLIEGGSEPPLDRILDDCLAGIDKDSIRWSKAPSFKCKCSRDRVLGALRLLGRQDREEIISDNKPVEVTLKRSI